MDYVRIPGVDLPVSRVVMGTDWLGARRFVYIRGRRFSSPFTDRERDRANHELLDGVVEAGCTAFDTARAYGDSERTLGAWLRARGLRDRVALITKGAHPGPGWTSRLSYTEIARDLERSLKELRTDYIDVYLLHYDDSRAEVGPLIDVLNQQLASGRIRSIGVSNWPAPRLARAREYAERTRQRPFLVSSLQFSLASWTSPPWQGALTLSGNERTGDREWYKQSDMWLLAYSSLAMGFFSHSRPYAGGESAAPAPQTPGDRAFLNAENLARLKRASEMAARLGISTGQVALAWVLRFDRRVLPIVGARNVASYVDAARACDVTLSEPERQWLSHGI